MFRFNNPDALMTLLIVVGGVLHDPRARGRVDALAAARRAASWASRSWPRGCSRSPCCRRWRSPTSCAAPDGAAAGGSAAARRRRPRWSSAPAGGCWPSQLTPGRRPSLHRRLGRQLRARPGLRLQRPRPAHRLGRRPAAAAAGFSGTTGVGRLFNALNGGQIAWLLPTALVAPSALAWSAGARRAPTGSRGLADRLGRLAAGHRRRAQLRRRHHPHLLHVELAPAIAALVGIGAVDAVAGAASGSGPGGAWPPAALVTGIWSYDAAATAAPTWHPWLRYVVLIAAVVAAALLLVAAGPGAPRARRRSPRSPASIALGGGSAAYAAGHGRHPADRARPRRPDRRSGTGGFGGPGRRFGGRRFGGCPGPVPASGRLPRRRRLPGGGTPGGAGGSARPADRSRATGRRRVRRPEHAGPRRGPVAGGGQRELRAGRAAEETSTTWAAAAIGSQTAARSSWRSGKAVMAIGGFSGSDAAPTLAQFEKLRRGRQDPLLHRRRRRRRSGRRAAAPARRSRPGSPRTTPRPPSAARPSTT